MTTFTGTNAAETIMPNLVSPTVAVNGSPATPSNADDTIEGGGGADIIDGGGGDDQVIGGDGNDEIFGGAGNDSFTWRVGDGHDEIDGDADFDTLDFTGSYSDDFIGVVNSAGQALINTGLFIAAELREVERVRIHTLGGGDYVEVSDLSGTGVTEVQVDLAATAGGSVGNGWSDHVRVSGGGGDDIISPTAAGALVTVNGLATQVTIAQTESNDALTFDGLGGNDTIDVAALAAAGFRNLTLDGWTGNDTLRGGEGADTFLAGDGNDTVVGRGGNDRIYLGSGNDTVIWNAGDGSDTIEGENGIDTLQFVGSNGNDQVDISANGQRVRLVRDVDSVIMDVARVEYFEVGALGGADNITVGDLAGAFVTEVTIDLAGTPNGTAGDGARDRVNINATAAAEFIIVGSSNGVVTVSGLSAGVVIEHAEAHDELGIAGSDGADLIVATTLEADLLRLTLLGGAGGDNIVGSTGDDTLEGGVGGDLLSGWAGSDTASYVTSSAGVTVSLIGGSASGGDAEGDTLSEIENLTGSAHGDRLGGDGGANVLTGGAGDDFLQGLGGDDTFEGSLGNDGVDGGTGTDTMIFTGNRSNYRIDREGGDGFAIVDLRPGQPFGTDTQGGVERLVFADGVFAPVAPLGNVVWRHNEGSVAVADRHLGVVSNSFEIRGTGDFDGDGDADILWHHDNGMVVTWEMQGGERVTHHVLPQVSTSFQIAGTGDFDGDGDADIVWRGNGGAVVTWEMEDGQFVTNHNLPSATGSFQVAGTGDFDGDGDADILWRGTAGQVVAWEMEDGAFATTHSLPQVSTSFNIAGTGDFDADGDADIMWRHSGGAVVTWEMEDGGLVTNHNLAQVTTTFQIAGAEDFDRDGDADILWRGAEGQVVSWEMEDGSLVVNHNFGFVANDWQIRGTGEFDLA